MPKVKFPPALKACPHWMQSAYPEMGHYQHRNWKTGEGEIIGVCMMAPSHIQRCIRMLIRYIRSVEHDNDWLDDMDFAWAMYQMHAAEAEDWLDVFLKERNMRIKTGRWNDA